MTLETIHEHCKWVLVVAFEENFFDMVNNM